jgi:hypothetical protein
LAEKISLMGELGRGSIPFKRFPKIKIKGEIIYEH